MEEIKRNKPKLVEEYLREVRYPRQNERNEKYKPSAFSLKMLTFIQMFNSQIQNKVDQLNKTPELHLKMLDTFVQEGNTINLMHRGSAKTTMLRFLILYLAIFREIDGFGVVPYALYISDSMENGVKKMRDNIETSIEYCPFIQASLDMKRTRFTDTVWEFYNKNGECFVVHTAGAQTGFRGTTAKLQRPVLGLLDDLVKDSEAESEAAIKRITDTVSKALTYALAPKHKVIWNGTPFNSRDPLYAAIESGSYNVNIFPICEKFPCTKEEFRGSWEDRFPYEYVQKMWEKSVNEGKTDAFNQELMLKILSEEDRVIPESAIKWFSRENILRNKHLFNFYITTDFAVKGQDKNDFSVISVWAYNYLGQWFWVDGVIAKQDMTANKRDLFRLVAEYAPLEVTVEDSGQQEGAISLMEDEMLRNNRFFNITRVSPGNKLKKHARFIMSAAPLFKAGLIFLPQEMEDTAEGIEMLDEIRKVHRGGFKSRHDDFLDTITSLPELNAIKPDEPYNGESNLEPQNPYYIEEERFNCYGNRRGYFA